MYMITWDSIINPTLDLYANYYMHAYNNKYDDKSLRAQNETG